MNHLHTELAPIDEVAWREINEEAERSLTHFLAARKLVDVRGPLGWEVSAVSTGRVGGTVPSSTPGVAVRQREALRLVEVRSELTLDRREIDMAARGAPDADLNPVVEAAKAAARVEDEAVFHGASDAGIAGIATASPHPPVELDDDYDRYPHAVARAIAALRDAGIAGPYGLALGPRCYKGVIETTEQGGYPLLEHLRLMLGGPVVWAPAVQGAIVVSLRGGDYELILGADFALGYHDHSVDEVRLYLESSMTFRVITPEAAVHLRYALGGDDAVAP